MTEPIFYDSYETPVVAGDIIMIERHYNYQHYNGEKAIVSWDSRNGCYQFVLEDRPNQWPSRFTELHSFKKIKNGK